MILRRLTDAIREQNWFAVAIEFVIVVSGVVIGFQISAWNEARQTRASLVAALELAHGEISENIDAADYQIERIADFSDAVDAMVVAIGTCTAPDDSISPFGDLVLQMGNDFSPTYDDSSLTHLLGNERFARFLPDVLREALNSYKAKLVEDREQHAINFNLMWDNHILSHPYLGAYMAEGFDNASLMLAVPFETACQDADFQRRFLITIAFLRSFELRMTDFRNTAEQTRTALEAELGGLD